LGDWFGVVEWIQLAHHRCRCRALVNMVMNLRVLAHLNSICLFINTTTLLQVKFTEYIPVDMPCRGSIPSRRERIFPLASVTIPALGPVQPPVQRVSGVLSPGLKCGRGVTLTTHPYLVSRSRMSRSYTSSPAKRFHGV
jgi:hypothetical protein